jgi:transposase
MTPEERIADLEAENGRLRADNRALRADNAGLREQLGQLLERMHTLEGRLAQDSHNSSRPPSSDGWRRRTKSLRQKSGRKPGGQLGHRGETLRLQATPDVVLEHRPTVCAGCQAPLDAEALVVGRERRQVQDLPPGRLVVTEHQALHLRCPACQQVSVGAFPAEAPSRAQYGLHVRALAVYLTEEQLVPLGRVQALLSDLFSVQVGRGTLVAWVQQAAAVLAPVEDQIKTALQQAPVLHVDETGVRRGGQLAWAHVASTSRLTHFAIHSKRGSEATDAIGILPSFGGVSVHDGWASYQTYTACRHALCNVHHLRELTFVEEEKHQAWAKEMKELLLAMRAAADQARAQGETQVPVRQQTALRAQYRALLARGRLANPPPDTPRRPGQRGRQAQSPTRNLLERLTLYEGQVLAFLADLTIPFDNNQAERDLRSFKVQQKISGCFRSDPGAVAYARIRGYLATMRKQGRALLAALEAVFAGQPLAPEFA